MPSTCCMLQMCWQFRKIDFNDVLCLYVAQRTDYKSRRLCGSWSSSKMRGVRRIQHSVKRVVFQQWRQTLFILSWASSSGLLVTFRHYNKRYVSVFKMLWMCRPVNLDGFRLAWRIHFLKWYSWCWQPVKIRNSVSGQIDLSFEDTKCYSAER